MKRAVWICCAAVAATALAAIATAVGQPADTPTPPSSPGSANPTQAPKPHRLLDQLPKAKREALGVEKMTESQMTALEDLIVSLVDVGSTARAAEAYLENEGFKKVTVSSPQRAKLEKNGVERDWIVLDCGLQGRWAVEPPILWSGMSGKYWAKISISGPQALLDTGGKEHRLTFSEKQELR